MPKGGIVRSVGAIVDEVLKVAKPVSNARRGVDFIMGNQFRQNVRGRVPGLAKAGDSLARRGYGKARRPRRKRGGSQKALRPNVIKRNGALYVKL